MGTTHKRARVPADAAKSGVPARISLVVPQLMRARIEALAHTERRNLNKQCELLLERALEAEEKKVA